METKHSRDFEYNQGDFAEKLQQITSRDLTVDNIDDYAESAFDDLVNLVREAEAAYNRQPTILQAQHAENEDAAFNYFEMESVGEILDYIADKAEQLRDIDTVIQQVTPDDAVFVPPDDLPGLGRAGEGSSAERPDTQPRLKTLLFVLANEFGLNANDPESVSIRCGSVNSEMMRQQPYYEVTVPTLERKVLICDGYGNATFVFDTSKLPDEVQAALVDSSKQQLSELINIEPGCGMALRCSKQFVPRLVGALRDEIDQPESQTGEGISYLDPDRNTELKTQAQVARELGVHVRTVARTVSAIDPKEFGSVITKGSRRYVKRFYTDKQMAMVKEVLENRGLLRQIPEGYVPVEDIIAANNISVATAYKAIKQLVLDGAMEQPDKYPGDGRAHKRPAIYCSPEQQQLIQRYVEDLGLNYPYMPDDYTTVPKFRSSLGVSEQSVLKAASTLGVELKKYRTRGHSRRLAISLSPEQQATIRGYLESEGFFRTAPEDYATFGQIHTELGVDYKTARMVISRLLDEGKLGEVEKYRKRHQVLEMYSPAQQEMIRDALGK